MLDCIEENQKCILRILGLYNVCHSAHNLNNTIPWCTTKIQEGKKKDMETKAHIPSESRVWKPIVEDDSNGESRVAAPWPSSEDSWRQNHWSGRIFSLISHTKSVLQLIKRHTNLVNKILSHFTENL